MGVLQALFLPYPRYSMRGFDALVKCHRVLCCGMALERVEECSREVKGWPASPSHLDDGVRSLEGSIPMKRTTHTLFVHLFIASSPRAPPSHCRILSTF